jgi:hypothetical protein
VTIFLVALVTDRAFLLHQPSDTHARWETIYEPRHVEWRSNKHLDYNAERERSDFFLLDIWCRPCPSRSQTVWIKRDIGSHAS